LLTESGSIFVQIGDENVHRVRAVMDEVFGEDNCVSQIGFAKTSGSTEEHLGQTTDYLLWFCKDKSRVKYRPGLKRKKPGEKGGTNYNRIRDIFGFSQSLTDDLLTDPRTSSGELRIYSLDNLTSQSAGRDKGEGAASWFGVKINGQVLKPSLSVRWKTNQQGMARLKAAGRLETTASRLGYVRYLDDFPVVQISNRWDDVGASFMADKIYVVQTSQTVIQRCLLMTTDPGDLVLDPTCGSGTTATVAEQWGRRWITLDTSRVALALAHARIMGARYPFYLLADSREGQIKEAEVSRSAPSTQPVHGNIRHGFVYERVPHVTLKSIANNAEIDVIWDTWQQTLEPLRDKLNAALDRSSPSPSGGGVGERASRHAAAKPSLSAAPSLSPNPSPAGGRWELTAWQEWEIPREADAGWPDATKKLHADWWRARIARQTEIDQSIVARAEFETLYDKPYENKKCARVAGPFTVESLSPHRMLGVDENDELIDTAMQDSAAYGAKQSFPQMILDNLRTAGVQQAHKDDRIAFTALSAWPGDLVCAEGRYLEGEAEKRAAIFIGPEFGTVQKPDLVAAAREAAEAGCDVLIACAFSYDALCTGLTKLGRIPILRARMNADLHMAEDLKNTGQGNLFVIFGEPDITLINETDGTLRVKVNGVDVFKPQTGEVVSDGADGIACWFIDTDYNEESFFVRHAYFLGANDPYNALKTTLKAEIDLEAWATLNSDTSRPFAKPKSGRIAVKVINHLGDEVMKVFRV
jgi:adenine-specific DNA-methyltransferase